MQPARGGVDRCLAWTIFQSRHTPGIPQLLADRADQAGRDIILWGGPTAAAAAIEAGLVDEYRLVTHPVIAGAGKKLFGTVAEMRRVRHQDTKTFPSGIVALTYARA
jgi:dihydrofolate reductase